MNLHARVLIFFILSSCLAACSMPGSGSAGSPGGSSGAAGTGGCANPLYPVVELARWDYQAENDITGPYTFSNTIVGPLTGDRFTVDVEYSTGVSVNLEWTCDSGDLIEMDAASGPAGVLSTTQGVSSTTNTENAAGITLPRTVNAGDTWQQSFDIDGEVHLPDGSIGTGKGSFSATYTAVGKEDVTVPAGTFNAMRVDMTSLYDLTVTVHEIEVPVPVTQTMAMWYAPDVGLVKAEITNDITGLLKFELYSYNIP